MLWAEQKRRAEKIGAPKGGIHESCSEAKVSEHSIHGSAKRMPPSSTEQCHYYKADNPSH
jgi:hypothetical protein